MDKKKTVAVVGLGYVGLPLAVEFARYRKVIGYDISDERVSELSKGIDRTREIEPDKLHSVLNNLSFTSNPEALERADVFIVTVPTPIDHNNIPDLTPIRSSSRTIGGYLRSGNVVIYESTVYPGVTEEICVPILEQASGLLYNKDFFVGYSPERINPGDRKNTLTKITKITSGSTAEVADQVDALYQEILEVPTYKVSGIRVAEAAKVIENTQRDINIAVINELAIIFDHMGIDTREVLDAASTKWNFLPFTPGLVGGHCIGIDPYYLSFRSEELGYRPNLILASRQINNGMGKFIAEKTIRLMIQKGARIRGARVLILGLTFKENMPDLRNTRVFDIIEELNSLGCKIEVYDPWISAGSAENKDLHTVVANPFGMGERYDAVIVAVAHDEFLELSDSDYSSILVPDGVLVDVKGIVPNPTWRL